MNFKKLKLEGVILVESIKFEDDRGYFSETYRQDKFDIFFKKKIKFCQENKSFSLKNVLRGLHYQIPPFAQSKLISVLSGSVIDIVLDIRKNSPTFGKSLTIHLDDTNSDQLFVPPGFAHGFLVTSESAIISYKVDNFYSKENERIINVKDQSLKLDLDFNSFNISKKDLEAPNLNESYFFDYNINYYE